MNGDAPPEDDVDPRFRYANERTFLAWIRTALALITAGLAVTQLLPEFKVAGGRRILGLPLIVLGIWACAAAFREWDGNERAMRAGKPISASRMPIIVAIGVGVVALCAFVLAAIGHKA